MKDEEWTLLTALNSTACLQAVNGMVNPSCVCTCGVNNQPWPLSDPRCTGFNGSMANMPAPPPNGTSDVLRQQARKDFEEQDKI